MQSFTRLLRLMTTQHNLTTLLVNTAVKTDTNSQSAFSSTKLKQALGVTWTFYSDTCILLHRSVEEDTIIVEVIRSRTGVQSSSTLNLIVGRNQDGQVLNRKVSHSDNIIMLIISPTPVCAAFPQCIINVLIISFVCHFASSMPPLGMPTLTCYMFKCLLYSL